MSKNNVKLTRPAVFTAAFLGPEIASQGEPAVFTAAFLCPEIASQGEANTDTTVKLKRHVPATRGSTQNESNKPDILQPSPPHPTPPHPNTNKHKQKLIKETNKQTPKISPLFLFVAVITEYHL